MTVLDCFAAQLADAVAFTAISEIPGSGGLDNVHCTGRETNLFDCPHWGVGVYICYNNFEDSGVVCPLQGIVCMLMLLQLWVWYSYTYT